MLDIIEVQDGQTVVDVACGTGDLIAAISRKADIKAHGIDIAEQMIKVAKETYQGISYKVSPATPLPFENATIDIITVSAAFHHFEEPQEFANECGRVLRPGGKVYIGEFCVSPAARHIMNFFARFVRTGDVKIYSDDELAAFFTKARFIIADIRMDKPLMVLTCWKK